MESIFPTRFTQLLNDSDMTYEEIAKKLGFKSKGTISKYAKGMNKKVDISTIIQIANLFDVSPIWLIGLTDDIHYKIK